MVRTFCLATLVVTAVAGGVSWAAEAFTDPAQAGPDERRLRNPRRDRS